jgi:F-type H+-transporting ATPase subunit a
MELPYEMNNQLALVAQQVGGPHSRVWDFSQRGLAPRKVFELLPNRPVPDWIARTSDYGIEAPNWVTNPGVPLPEPLASLFRFYGISLDNRKSLVDSITNIIDLYFRDLQLRLPEGYTINDFCDQFLGYDHCHSLLNTFLDLFWWGPASFTWDAGVMPVFAAIWAAEPSIPIDIRDQIALIIQVYLENGGGLINPLDQFSLHPYIPLHMGNFFVSFTNLSLSMLLTLVLVLVGFFVVTKKGGGKLVPNALQSLVEQIYDFVLNLVNEQIGGLSGNVKQKFFPCILVTFTFLLFCNLQGMIPFSFTVTSHFLITLALSFSIFIGITIVGFQRHGLHFFSFLLPAGVPLALAPFLVLLELISYCFRALSLGIRLFANMMAGHSLVKILSGFAWTMLFLNNIFYFIGDLGPLFIILALTGLELGVAILQAYVFTILICIYLNDAINLH